MTCSFYNWRFVPFISLHFFHPSPRRGRNDIEQALDIQWLLTCYSFIGWWHHKDFLTSNYSELKHKPGLNLIHHWCYCFLQKLINILSLMDDIFKMLCTSFKPFTNIHCRLVAGQIHHLLHPNPPVGCRKRHGSRWSACLPSVLGIWVASLTHWDHRVTL